MKLKITKKSRRKLLVLILILVTVTTFFQLILKSQEQKDTNKSVYLPTNINSYKLNDGTYTVGEGVMPGIYKVVEKDDSAVITISTPNPDGSVGVKDFSYLKIGDVFTVDSADTSVIVTGGSVKIETEY